ncbi:hypothetical protein CSE45_3424 [Citreicella sp. SE45]|nr:hypothetical protein CSE45_3424 [Citreicella sp. SE45]
MLGPVSGSLWENDTPGRASEMEVIIPTRRVNHSRRSVRGGKDS